MLTNPKTDSNEVHMKYAPLKRREFVLDDPCKTSEFEILKEKKILILYAICPSFHLIQRE